MRTVGLRELKNNLSRYVRQVQAGQAVVITDRGQVIAELISPRLQDDPVVRREEMARQGTLVLAKPLAKRERLALYRPRSSLLKGVTSQQLLDQDRGER